jgi:hypothetical protein
MMISHKHLAAVAAVGALSAAPIAWGAGGASATSTPKSAKAGKPIEMLVKGMKPNEKVKSVEAAPFGQKRTLYPRAGHGGSLVVKVVAQIKGKHTWTFTGRTSHRRTKTSYTVK